MLDLFCFSMSAPPVQPVTCTPSMVLRVFAFLSAPCLCSFAFVVSYFHVFNFLSSLLLDDYNGIPYYEVVDSYYHTMCIIAFISYLQENDL